MEISEQVPKEDFSLVYKHSGTSGDIIYSLPGVAEQCRKTGKSAEYYIRLYVDASYYQGAVHPYGNIMMNEYSFKMMKPLIEAQPYIKECKVHQGEPIHFDLDLIRQRKIGLPNGDISMWYWYIFPDMVCDLSQKWIHYNNVPQTAELVKDAIIVNVTERYRNNMIDYSFLQHLNREIVFAGTQKEYQLFTRFVPKASYLMIEDFNDLACAIDNCFFFMGNQSMCYAIAEGLKKDRTLELCSFAPNVIPHGKNGYGFYAQTALLHYVKKLLNGERP